MDSLVTFNDAPIAFDVTLGAQSLTHLTITNVSDGDVAYKMKTTSPRRYFVRPNADVLPLGTAIDIEVALQAFDATPPDFHSCKDKFQLLVAPVSAAGAEAAIAFADGFTEVSSLWKRIAPEDTCQAKFKVALRLADTDTASASTTAPAAAVLDLPFGAQPLLKSSVRDEYATVRALSTSDLASFTANSIPSRTPARLPLTPEPINPVLASSRNIDLSPGSNAILSAAPTIPERKLALDQATKESEAALVPTASSRTVALGPMGEPVAVRRRLVDIRLEEARVAEATALATGHAATMAATSSARASAELAVAAADTEEREVVSRGDCVKSTKVSTFSVFADAAKPRPAATTVLSKSHDKEDREVMSATRQRVLAGVAAPQVDIAALSEHAAQRAAVERAGELIRIAQATEAEIITIRTELAEARHKLSDTKMAVLPAYDVKYEVDESARIPLIQIAIMAAISGVVLKMLV
jgi:MSP (Major sperm protein) domain